MLINKLAEWKAVRQFGEGKFCYVFGGVPRNAMPHCSSLLEWSKTKAKEHLFSRDMVSLQVVTISTRPKNALAML